MDLRNFSNIMPAGTTKLVTASTSFKLLCVVCLIIINNPPIKAQEESLPDKVPLKIDHDYVTPIKHYQLPLSDENNSNRSSGNFRNESSKVWDSKPNYIFHAFDQLLHLVLKQDSSFVSKEIFGTFEKLNNHTDKKDLPEEDYLECFYDGHVKGDNQSTVAVSLCHGMTGYIKTSLGALLIEPANNQTILKAKNANDTSEILHKIWRFPKPAAYKNEDQKSSVTEMKSGKPAAKYDDSAADNNLKQNKKSSVTEMKSGNRAAKYDDSVPGEPAANYTDSAAGINLEQNQTNADSERKSGKPAAKYNDSAAGINLKQNQLSSVSESISGKPAAKHDDSVDGEPVANYNNSAAGINLEKIQKSSFTEIKRENPTAKYDDSAAGINLEQNQTNADSEMISGERNYETKPLTLELLVAFDQSMIDFHKKDIYKYVNTLISITSKLFIDESFGNSLKVILTKTVKLKKKDFHLPDPDAVNHLCSLLRRKNHKFDAAILLTRDHICNKRRNKNCNTLGFAQPGSICTNQSCSVIRDNGLQTAFTIAHELGHILNIPHDDDFLCEEFNKKNGQLSLNVMSSHASNDSHPWMWSDCSRHYFYEYVEQQKAKCLENTPISKVSESRLPDRLPGEKYSLDRQCQLIYGQTANSYCPTETDAPCQILRCHNRNKPNSPCRTNNVQWADGTKCSDAQNWCQKGKCVPRQI